MLSRVNGVVWLEGEEEDTVSWTRAVNNGENKDELGLSTFKSMLDEDWYVSNNPSNQENCFHTIQNHHEIKEIGGFSTNPTEPLLVDSSSSCSPSSVFNLDPSQVQSFLPTQVQKSCLSSLINIGCSNPFENNMDLSCDGGFLASLGTQLQSSNNPSSNSNLLMNRGGILSGFSNLSNQSQMGTPNLSPKMLPLNENTGFGGSNFGLSSGNSGFESSAGVSSLFMNRSNKVLRPLEIFPSMGAQPTLFQKRAALRQNSANLPENLAIPVNDGRIPLRQQGFQVGGEEGRRDLEEELEKRRKNMVDEDEMDEGSIDGSGLQYDSDEATENKLEENVDGSGGMGSSGFRSLCNSNANSPAGDQKGKKKGLPAKNLMAERRRRKKLNDRLYMLRSVVPKISKMDRASILGDAIEYLKELLQRINDLHNELESSPSGSSMPSATSFHPLTPTPATLPCRVKEELCPSSLPSPNSQPARIQVRVSEGRAVNIHMFCARRPGLLLSTMRALDGLGLDVQQAVISCFNGFALDVFRAEQCKEGPDALPEEIKAVLLHSAGFQATM